MKRALYHLDRLLVRYREVFRAVLVVSLLSLPVVWLAGCGLATWLADANSILPVIANSVVSLLSLIALIRGGAVSAAEADTVTTWATSAENAITAIQTMVEDYQQQASTTLLGDIQAAVKAFTDDATKFLSALHVVDPASQAKIEDIVQLILSQVQAWATVIPALTATSTAAVNNVASTARVFVRATTVQLTVPLTKKAYKQAFDQILSTPSGSAEVDAALAKVKKL